MHHIFHDVLINSTKEQVFKAISEPNQLVHWWPFRCSGMPNLDSEYNFFFTEEYNWFGKVIQIKEYKSFHIKMTQSDSDWDPTTFGFEIKEMKNGIMLEFFHKNWPVNNHHYRRSAYCWALLLNGLKKYIEHGIILPFEERA